MTNLDAALALAAAGIPVFPCQTQGWTNDDPPEPLHKKPCPGVMWAAQATARPNEVERFWRRWPDAAPGIKIAGTSFIVIDCDPPKSDGQQNGIEWFQQICEANEFDIDTVPIVKTPSGGWHVYFRRPAGAKLGNGRGSLPPKAEIGVDIRGAGGYVLGPGAEIDTGRYELLDGLDITEAPDLPPFLLELLTSRRAAVVQAPAGAAVALGAARGAVTAREEAYALNALQDECAMVAGTPKGGRNEALNTSALKMGTMVGAGWISEAKVRADMTAAIAGWTDPKKTLGTLDRALAAGICRPREALPPVEDDGALERGNALAAQLDGGEDEAAEEEADEPDEDEGAPAPEDLPDEFFKVDGLVGEIAEWIMSTAPVPIHAFAVTTALVLVGALVARQVYAGPLYTGTHLYTIMLAGTGAGKDRYRSVIGQFLGAVGRVGIVAGGYATSSTLASQLGLCPARVCVQDEVHGLLAKLNNPRSSNQEAELMRSYCTVWGSNLAEWRPETTLSRQLGAIERPWMSFVGFTQPVSFRDQMKSRAVANGFMNRFLVVPVYKTLPDWEEPPGDMLTVPPELIERARALMTFNDAAGDGRGIEQSALWAQAMPPKLVGIKGVPEAEELLKAIKHREMEIRRTGEREGNDLSDIWSRYAEMVRRISAILAIGRHPNSMIACKVTVADVVWADRFVTWSLENLERELSQNMADTQHQADMLHVLGIIRKARKISRSELYHKLKGRFNKMTMESILAMLQIGLNIREEKDKTAKPKRGVKPTVYIHLRG